MSLYAPLQSPNSIRVLTIDSSPCNSSEVSIRCQLLEIDLEASHEKYLAISYTRGDPVWRTDEETDIEERRTFLQPDFEIHVNELPFYVRKNLLVLLYRLQCFPDLKYVWVDAICVNQADTDERNAQVTMMGDIYDRADSVFIWLGVTDENSTIALPLLRTLGIAMDKKLDSGEIDEPHSPVFRFLTGLTVRGPPRVFNDRAVFDFFGVEQFIPLEWCSIA